MVSHLPARIRALCRPRERVLAAVIAVVAGVVVVALGSEVFPYLSSNHDEGVYLQQAELFLHGQVRLYPGSLGDAVRPWFFVDGGDHFYPKYQPLPAGFFALSMALFGTPAPTLGVVAASNTGLVYLLGAQTFDRRVGVLAAGGFAVAPLTLLTSSVYLPYAPTTAFSLAFAAGYLHSYRTGSRRSALLAGAAIGVAFLMRPYTAVLFAAPFLGHAGWELVAAERTRHASGDGRRLSGSLLRQATTAVVGLTFVGLALAYNWALTGSPLTFPYEAFAPMDGPGFGRRRILSHSIDYTPTVAVRSNAYVLWYFVTRWAPAGAVGSLLALVGVLASALQRSSVLTARGDDRRRRLVLPGSGTAQLLLAGLFVTVPLGNLFFWGNFNVLATPSDPTDGLLGLFGPFYHFDLLAPVAIFGAAGLVACWRLRGTLSARLGGGAPVPGSRTGRALALSILLVSVLVLGGVNALLLTGPVDRNLEHTERHEVAYEPFEQRSFDDAVVYLPTPYGDWLNHPFQYLRNEPGFDGETVYVLDRGPAADFRVFDAYPDRTHVRYTYRGEWTADPDANELVPLIERLDRREGERLVGETTVSVPARVESADVRLETSAGYQMASVIDPDEEISLAWTVDRNGTTLRSVDGTAVAADPVALQRVDELTITVRLSQSGAGTLSYRQVVPIRTAGTGVEAIWPPERTVCPLVDECGRAGTYLPDRHEEHRDGRSFETGLQPAARES